MRTIMLVLIVMPLIAIGDVSEAIVKIYTIRNVPDYYNPWSMQGPQSSTGSGCIIGKKKILTNAHVVSDQTFIQVRRYGEARKYRARVSAVAHHVDLALLEVEDESFFEGIEPLGIGAMPEGQQDVLVYGFPLGGDTMSITKGVISRIEHQQYAHSSGHFLAGQIDAAINPGNSGGPVIVDGRIVGVVMQNIPGAQNIGYMVPVNRILHFFEDIDDGRYDGIPSMGMVYQPLENESMRRKYLVPDDVGGVLVTRIVPGAAADGILREGDVLIRVEDHEIAEDGSIVFRGKERTSLSYYVQEKQVGDLLFADIIRDGRKARIEMKLSHAYDAYYLIPMEQYDRRPVYYIYGGLVFMPLTKNLLERWGGGWYNRAPKELVAMLSDNIPEEEGEEIVLLLKVLPAAVNEGYHQFSYMVIDRIDGEEILNMKELVRAAESNGGEFVTFSNESKQIIVLDRAKAQAAMPEILELYRIESDRSDDLSQHPTPNAQRSTSK